MSGSNAHAAAANAADAANSGRVHDVFAMTWFGASWEAPINLDCEHVDTPVGEPCLRCGEPIEAWASGVLQSCYELRGHSRRPQHLECFLRGTVGSAGHLRGRCSCYGGHDEDPPGLTTRDAARAACLTFLEVWNVG